MGKLKKSFLYISLFLVYTQGMWERTFNFSEVVGYIVELSAILFIIYPPKLRLKKSPAYYLMLLYVALTFITSLINPSELMVWFKYIRFFIYFYLIFNQLWNTPLQYEEWKKLFMYLILLTILQGVGSAYTLLILGRRVEGYVGLMSSLGGTTATIFPLLVVSLSLLLYFFYRRKNQSFNILLIICIASVFLVGYVSTKRAIYFIIPAFMLIDGIITFYYLGNNTSFIKKIIVSTIILLLLVPVYIFGMKNEHGFNYVIRGDENNIEIIRKAFEFAKDYESGSQNSRTLGRTGTTLMVINYSLEDTRSFLFGHGIRAYKDVRTQLRLGFSYGIVGFTAEILSTGWINMILQVIIFFQIIFINKSYKTKLTSSIRIILLLIFAFTHFTYGPDFTNTLKINFVLAIICAFINSPIHKLPLKKFIVQNFYY